MMTKLRNYFNPSIQEEIIVYFLPEIEQDQVPF